VEPVEEEPPENHDSIRTLENVPRFLEWSTNEADVWRYYLEKKGVKDSKNMDVFCVVCYLQGTEVEKCYKKMNGGTTNLWNHVNIAKSGHVNIAVCKHHRPLLSECSRQGGIYIATAKRYHLGDDTTEALIFCHDAIDVLCDTDPRTGCPKLILTKKAATVGTNSKKVIDVVEINCE
jgi:hypothetical protein